jgi:hypothetical protein
MRPHFGTIASIIRRTAATVVETAVRRTLT